MKENGGVLEVRLGTIDIDEDRDDYAGLTKGKYILLTVSDTGTGISPEIKETIFAPFFTTKPVGEGSGLGLSVIQGIIASHGGIIVVESKIGQGAEFNVLLPTTDEAANSKNIARLRGAESPERRGNGHILLVDDEPDIAECTSDLLEHLGYQVTKIQVSPDALDLFRTNPGQFDLVLTDQAMPQMSSGTELTQKILAIHPDIPVILATGNMSAEDVAGSGIRAKLQKPYTLQELGTVIREILD